ncbi:hypothetical protein AUJ46_05500 [Candidatus Peregrinibacteria bacterium CG1_02_54_53]|nr:MAG: hypothetical protein AUJ46_05500 [Candidatus Peregrinibacteria bacterium CG1_02_54_53]
MADPKTSSTVQISEELQKKYPELIQLVLKSESMNDEERQYWVNILPVMTPEQIQNLQDILTNEKEQLAAIDRKYAKEIERIGETQLLQKVDDERRKRRENRLQKEEQSREQENAKAAEILGKIQDE